MHDAGRVTNGDGTPYRAYAVILGSFAGALAATAALESRLGREQQRSPFELVLLGGATFKAARAISRERVGSVVREPFVETEPSGGIEAERPRGDGMRRAVGELVTCTRCVGTWSAAGIVATNAVSPRFGRLLTWTLAAGAANDILQAAFVALCARADEIPQPVHMGRGRRPGGGAGTADHPARESVWGDEETRVSKLGNR